MTDHQNREGRDPYVLTVEQERDVYKLAAVNAARERDILAAALRRIDVDIVGLHRFDADGYCCICGGGNITHTCEACVAHNALEDAAMVGT